MTSDGGEHRLHLVLERGEDSDQEELDRLTGRLRDRLLELDVQRVELSRSGRAPDGAKPAGTIALGALVVTTAPFALRSVVRLLQTWLENRPVRAVTLTVDGDSIEVQAVSRADQHRLIEAFIAQHGPTPPPGPEPAPAADPGL
ncbi:hypothetical protein [Streptomyces sp. NPDC047000]|uniref:effector-associated constant component EACC1 n=1 Tax=Streptomyces sp. NPDC047000 TaxID=3155474 RepID=UPI0033F76CA0